MLLDICEKNFLFFQINMESIELFCYLIIFISFLLCFIIYSRRRSENNFFFNNVIMLFSSLLFFLFVVLIIMFMISDTNDEGCYCKVEENRSIKSQNNFSDKPVNDIVANKIIVVGDSRMELIQVNRNNLDVPINFSFIAKSGAKIDWLYNVAVKQLEQKLDNLDKDYNYHVVFNMGVNDLNQLINYDFRVKEYYNIYKSIILKYPNVKFYLLSVNPVTESKINQYWFGNIRTNQNIQKFNNYIIQYLERDNLFNAKYCDSYNSFNFGTYDGLHYDNVTNKKIIEYIVDECVNYKKSL